MPLGQTKFVLVELYIWPISRSNLLWVHGGLCIVYLIMIVALMRHFSVNLRYDPVDEQVC